MILKHRDRNILRFEWLEPYGVRVLEVFEENLKFLPLEMKGAATDDALWMWLKHRIASYNRWNILTLHSVLRLRFRSVRDVIVCCKALSLNDVFWVVEDDFNGQWSQFSLYQNRLDVNVASWTLIGNFGFIVDNDTNDIVDIAPVFDNGESLFVTEKVFPKLVRYPLKITHAQQQNLEKLLNFRFKKHHRHNLSEDRLHAMELRIRVQVQKLLKNQRKAA